MNLRSFFTFFSTVATFVGPLVTMADQTAQATGSQKLEAVTGSLVKIGTVIAGVEAKVESELPLVQAVISEFADMKHALETAVAAVEGAVKSASGTPPAA